MRELVIPCPEEFYSDTDEAAFFYGLRIIAGIDLAFSDMSGIHLKLCNEVSSSSIMNLIGLLFRYNVKTSCLTPLAERNSWMKDKDYWYDDMWN